MKSSRELVLIIGEIQRVKRYKSVEGEELGTRRKKRGEHGHLYWGRQMVKASNQSLTG